MKKVLSIMVVMLFLFSIAAFARNGADDSSSDDSSNDFVNGVKVRGDGSIDDDQTPDDSSSSDDSSDDFVNGVKVRGDGSIDDDQNGDGIDDSSDDFVNGVKLRGDGSIDDDQNGDGIDDSSDDFVNGVKLRGDGSIDDEMEIRSSVSGLENAMIVVRKDDTKESLEQVLEKIQEKRKEQLAKLEGISIEKDERTNAIVIKGKGRAKFLGFISTDKTYEYEIDDNGDVKKHGKFFDFMFKKDDPVDS